MAKITEIMKGMPRPFTYLLRFGLPVCVLIWLLSQPDSRAQDFPRVCHEEGNLMRNCQFDGGLDGWSPFLSTGSAEIEVQHGGGECHAPLCPAVHVVTHDHFIGGIYQQVPATPGVNYYANVLWLVFDSLVNDASIHNATGGIDRRVGIDPLGGTDPNSSNIVWSPENRGNACKTCLMEQVTATAQAETITVFVKIDDQWRLRAAEKGYGVPPSKDQFWIDDVGVKAVGGEPAGNPDPTAGPPTDTPPPPTDTPPPPTETPLPTATLTTEPDAPVIIAQAAVADESIAEADAVEVKDNETEAEPTSESTVEIEPTAETVVAVATNTPIPPPPTLTPTRTPLPTETPAPRPTRLPRPALERSSIAPVKEANLPLPLGVFGTMGCVGGLGFSLAGGIVLGGLVWLVRIGWGKGNNHDD
jgi:hypothetical protein